MKEAMIALMVWISNHTGLPVPDSVPAIRFANTCQMQDHTAAKRSPDCGKSRSPNALYHLETQTIYLQPNWSFKRAADRMTLVHELTHHMQRHAWGIEAWDASPCAWVRWERQAYETELAYADAMGYELGSRDWYKPALVCLQSERNGHEYR